MRTKRGIFAAQLNVEVLEDRRMLAGALGMFTRIGGYVDADADSRAISHDVSTQNMYVSPHNTVYDDSGQRPAWAYSDLGFAFAEQHSVAFVPTELQSTSSVVQANVSTISKTHVNGVAEAYTEVVTDGPVASGEFQYVADPLYSDNLYFHGHLFLATSHGDVKSGDGDVDGIAHVSANAPFASGLASLIDSDLNLWLWAATVNGEDFGGYSVGGVNVHLNYVVPYSDGSGADLEVHADTEMSAISNIGSAASLTSGVSAAWGYVTVGPDDLTPGDFNYDGDVDREDFDIWANGQPQADANLDAKVDAQDYAVWAANADAILVSTNVDENDGNYSYGDLSLREAIALAANSSHPGADIIAFDASLLGRTITLTQGQLNLAYNNPVKILGPGADQLTINGNGGTISIFNVMGGGGTPIESTISHLKLTGTSTSGTGVTHSDSNGNHDLVLDSLEITGNGYGVKHSASGQLVIRNSTIANNYWDGITRTTHSPPADYASVTISDTKVQDNGAYGISLKNLDVSISDSEISANNTRGVSAKGIYFRSDDDNPGVTLTIAGSTIAQNHGDGIVLGSQTESNIFNSTISSNDGVGLSVTDATAALTNVTVTENRVATSGATAGVYADIGATVTMHNTIVTQNYSGSVGSEVDADLGKSTTSPAGSFSVGTSSYNLIGVVGNSGITSSNHNIILAGADAGLAPLGDYGGTTRTHALLLTSLAVDAGDDSKATAIGLLYDQRGEALDRIVDRDGVPDAGFDIDIGAFELALSEIYG